MSEHGSLHAVLAPSAAERWMTCPASVGLIASLGRDADSTSVYAAEGTRAHNLAEIEASYAFKQTSKKQYTTFKAAWLDSALEHGDDVEEMERHVRGYIALLRDLLAEMPDGTIRLEQRVETGIPGCWGTGDAILANATHVQIVDLKYGQGVSVSAHENPQLKLYGVGALEMLDGVLGDIETVGMTICQPRTDNISHFTMLAKELRAWRDAAIPVAEETKRADARFGPSDTACRWCPVSGICTARRDHMIALDFGRNASTLTVDELAEIVRRIPEIRDWCAAVEAEALRQAYSEKNPLPGLKVVLSGGRRKITDEDEAIQTLVAAGFKREQVSRTSLQTFKVLEKLVGKQRLSEVLGDLLVQGAGSPALVDEGDPRQAIDALQDARRDFQDSPG